MNNADKKDFCITHFFNPVRYMGLLEIVEKNQMIKIKLIYLKDFCEKTRQRCNYLW